MGRPLRRRGPPGRTDLLAGGAAGPRRRVRRSLFSVRPTAREVGTSHPHRPCLQRIGGAQGAHGRGQWHRRRTRGHVAPRRTPSLRVLAPLRPGSGRRVQSALPTGSPLVQLTILVLDLLSCGRQFRKHGRLRHVVEPDPNLPIAPRRPSRQRSVSLRAAVKARRSSRQSPIRVRPAKALRRRFSQPLRPVRRQWPPGFGDGPLRAHLGTAGDAFGPVPGVRARPTIRPVGPDTRSPINANRSSERS
ncbi:hypothetical protein EDF27_0486 [Curtobacterium sp. PhB136]|nr:hypothetical protein EDF27_0486 [Curtobacterium sp. PhB136]